MRQGGAEALTAYESDRRPVALVAGGSRGLGLLLARELGRTGHRVVICARTASELVRATETLRGEGLDVRHRVCDVGDATAVEDLVAGIEAEDGAVEVMICVAGVIQVGPLASVTRAHFETAVDTMLWGPVNTSLAVAERMRERGRGRIGVIASVGGLIAAPHLLPYSTAKFGAVGFGRGLRSELAGTGVTVTTVTPGLMRTGSHLRAQFVGDQPKEYAWFAPAASLPLLSMDANRAARRIVAAVLAGRSVLSPTPLAKIAPKVDALFPQLTSAMLGFTTRLLPAAPAQVRAPAAVDGIEAEPRLDRSVRRLVAWLTRLGAQAARKNLETPPSGGPQVTG